MANDIFNTKKLGFGLMRLPKKPVLIDAVETAEMTDLFLDAGFTYFDTAYVYLGSEAAARKALKNYLNYLDQFDEDNANT